MTEKTVLNERKMPNYIDQKNESVQEVAQDVLERAKKYGYKPDEDMVRGSVEESANLLNIVLTEAQIVEACQQVMTPREVPQHEITVHDFEGRPSGEVYDLTQTDDSIKDGDVINLGNGNVAILMNAWPTVVVGEIEHFHRLVSGVTFESIDGGKYAASAAKALEVSNYKDPNQVYETGSDDTFWNSKVIRVGERFNVQVFDADGDRRPDREDSFADQALAIAFADKSVQRYSGREVAERIVPANSLVEYRMLLDRWRTADGTAKSSGITDSIRAAAVAEVEAVAEALRLSPFGLDEKGRVAERKMLKRMESNERYVVVRLCVANQIQYLGRVSSLKEFEEYRECCGFEKSDIAVQDWKPAG